MTPPKTPAWQAALTADEKATLARLSAQASDLGGELHGINRQITRLKERIKQRRRYRLHRAKGAPRLQTEAG